MFKSARYRVLAAALFFLPLVVASGVRAADLIDRPAPLSPPVKLILGAGKVPHHAPIQYIVDEAKPLGVDVEVVVFQRYADTRTALASGSIDVGTIGPADVPIAVSQGIDSVIGLMGVGRSVKNPIVRKGVEVSEWDDLLGKKVGIAPGSAVWFQFAAMTVEAGIPYNKLDIINIQGGGTSFLQAMQRGDIDVFIGWEPYESQAILDGMAYRVDALDYSTSKAVGAELGMLGVNREYLNEQREAVRRFLWAYLKIENEISESKEKLAQAIAAYTGLPADVSMNVAKATTLGQFLTLDQMKRQAATFHELGVLTKDVSDQLDRYFDQELVASVTEQ